MDFDPHILSALQALRSRSTWFINGAHIEITAPRAYAIQGLLVLPARPHYEPGGVVRLNAPGQYSDLIVTAIRATTADGLAAERHRLELHLAGEATASALANQMPIASAIMRGAILPSEPSIHPPETTERREHRCAPFMNDQSAV